MMRILCTLAVVGLITLATISFTKIATGQSTKKDANIKMLLPDGKGYEIPAKELESIMQPQSCDPDVVVKYKTKYKTRWKTKWKTRWKEKPAQIKIVEKPVEKIVYKDKIIYKDREVEKIVNVETYKKNEVKVHLGVGTIGLIATEEENGDILVTEETSLIVGAGYTRRFSADWSLGLDAYANKTMSVGLGYNW